MNLLRTDEQTIGDLEIFGKKSGQGILDIYNHANTRGGAALLSDLFRNPLSDKQAINRRSSIIENFARLKVRFPYDAGFAGYSNCLFIVSTHIIEVGDALQEKKNIQFVYMPTIMEGNIPRYPYKLERGITEDRQGMLIISNEGILDALNNPKG